MCLFSCDNTFQRCKQNGELIEIIFCHQKIFSVDLLDRIEKSIV